MGAFEHTEKKPHLTSYDDGWQKQDTSHLRSIAASG